MNFCSQSVIYCSGNLELVLAFHKLSVFLNCEAAETFIKDETEEEFIQLSSTYDPFDGKDSVSYLQSEPPRTSQVAESFNVKNVLSNNSVEAKNIHSDHSIGASVEQGIARSIKSQVKSSQVVEYVPSEVLDLNNDAAEPKKCVPTSFVNKEHTVGTNTSQGLNRSDDGENTAREIPVFSHSTVAYNAYPCTVCGFKLYHEKYLEEHMRFHTGEKLECSVCGKKFLRQRYLDRHVGIHTGEKPYECSFCDKKFRLKEELTVHKLRHTGDLPQCQVCGGRFVALQKHMLTHSDVRYNSYFCSVCQKGFRMQCHLNKHMMTHTDERPYTCQDCGGRFRCFTHLKTHMASHTKEKKHTCHVCGKMFLQRGAVYSHMRTHTGDKPYDCETCGQKFRQASQLAAHRATHSSEKSFICTTCGKGFRLRGHLSRHELIHSGVQPYECSVCGLKFNQSCSVQRHMLTHTGEKPYVCSDCGLRFTQSGGLCSHRRLHCHAKNTQA